VGIIPLTAFHVCRLRNAVTFAFGEARMAQRPLDLANRFEYEAHFQAHGYTRIAGVDEVGRGALAGPLVAAAVILPPHEAILADLPFWCRVRDSKTISHKQRTLIAAEIRQRCPAVSLAAIPPALLDEIGVGAANRMAMELAVRALPISPDLLLIDAMTIDSGLPQIGIIDGDAKSLSIAAASIVAKVTRDAEMCELDMQFPAFGFARHKGYGVAAHLAALVAVGPCEHHRYSFAPVRNTWRPHAESA
jgi:ribonuclease HII